MMEDRLAARVKELVEENERLKDALGVAKGALLSFCSYQEDEDLVTAIKIINEVLGS